MGENYSIPETTSQADELYSTRQRVDHVRSSVAILQSLAARTNDYGIHWRLGRAFFFLGQGASPPESARSYYSQGIAGSEVAVISEPDKVEGHFWLGVNLALVASCEGRWPAIRHARRARRELRRAVEIDSSYHAAGPLRVLARLQHKLPRWLGGSVIEARTNFESAILLAPENTVTRIYFAELLLESGERDRAREQLGFTLAARDNHEWSFEIERDKRIAKDMLKTLGPAV